MTILIKAGTGLLAGVVAGALGLAFVPRMQPNGVTPRAAVGHPQFVAATVADAPVAAPTATMVAVPVAPTPAKPSPEASRVTPPAAPVVLTRLEPPKPAPAVATPAAATPATAAVQTPTPVAAATPSPAPVVSAPSQAASHAVNEVSARWSVQGLAALAKGDLSSARLFLTRAADAGDPRAWVALADTYDPTMLTRLGVVGAPGDPKRAKDYLQKAADAGLVVARNRMAALEPGGASFH